MFRFAAPYMFYLLAVVVALAGLFAFAVRMRRRRLERFGDPRTVAQLMPEASPRRVRNKFVLFAVATGLIVVALAQPQFGSKLRSVSREGVEMMLAVDVSNSMLAKDIEPSRLERTKYAINRVLESLGQDRVGLVAFAGQAFVQLPVTSDYVAAKNFVNRLSPTVVSRQGTAIGAAIALAASSFSSESEGARVIVLITDGENHDDDPLAAAAAAEKQGIRIYVIGIGTPEGSPIAVGNDFIRDEQGKIVVTKLDEELLQKIALNSGGAYIRANNNSLGLSEIVQKIRETDKKKFTASIFEEFNEQYQYLLAAAIVLLLLEGFIIARKNRILARFNIFK
ncbi:MAG: VWA domain-containing protein [Rikenellaceae bacterium]|jgi:Ca-activated chloride channel family protein|nr:VWA domain-containing protein [Rikenellaceae bacterium]